MAAKTIAQKNMKKASDKKKAPAAKALKPTAPPACGFCLYAEADGKSFELRFETLPQLEAVRETLQQAMLRKSNMTHSIIDGQGREFRGTRITSVR
tara:strand:+ start:2294 stop:2581 length:288 start_codon:yes stop_codon:yes gene_type:complete